jgi:hypothetical protein
MKTTRPEITSIERGARAGLRFGQPRSGPRFARGIGAAALRLSSFLGVVTLLGCSSLRRPPADVAHVQIELAHSPLVSVTRASLVREHALVLKGYVLRQHDATDTTRTHLDVTLLDAQGRVLRETIERFEPSQIPRRIRLPDSASFAVVLDPLPPGTSRIVVRAHEGDHE